MKYFSDFFKIPFVQHGIINFVGMMIIAFILIAFHSVSPDLVNGLWAIWVFGMMFFAWQSYLPTSAIFCGYLITRKTRAIILRIVKQERQVRKAIRGRKFVIVTPFGAASTADLLDILIKQKKQYKTLIKSIAEKTAELQEIMTRKKIDNN